jgi:3D (Asp-Asp-Asp) domain-containing protein
MPNLVRGGAVLMLLSLFVAFVYAQTNSGRSFIIANDSQKELIGSKAVQIKETQTATTSTADNSNKEKLVKTTALVTAAKKSAASKGSFTATAYCLRGRTAMGHGVRRGIIAADPRVLRLGSTVNITSGAYAGQYLVSDTGGKIKGKKIDIWVPSCSEARRFGRRTVQISQ